MSYSRRHGVSWGEERTWAPTAQSQSKPGATLHDLIRPAKSIAPKTRFNSLPEVARAKQSNSPADPRVRQSDGFVPWREWTRRVETSFATFAPKVHFNPACARPQDYRSGHRKRMRADCAI